MINTKLCFLLLFLDVDIWALKGKLYFLFMMKCQPCLKVWLREIQFSSLDMHVFSLKRVCVLMGSPFPSLFTLLYPWVWTFVTCRISVIFFCFILRGREVGVRQVQRVSHMWDEPGSIPSLLTCAKEYLKLSTGFDFCQCISVTSQSMLTKYN